jgi:protein SCO1/2
MIGTLYVVWGEALRRDLAWLRSRRWGRGLLATLISVPALGAALAARHVARTMADGSTRFAVPALVFDEGARRVVPLLRLVDQSGSRFHLASLRGEQVVVTFAFGHCETMCPSLVRDVLNARLEAGSRAAVVVVTVDPWRDVPERLPHIASSFGLGARDRVLSGSVPDVLQALESWSVSTVRDEATGDVVHPAVVVLVDAEGRVAARLTKL